MYYINTSTCFEQYYAHLQEVKIVFLQQAVKIQLLPPVYVPSTSSSSRLTKMWHHLCRSDIVKWLSDIQTTDEQTEISVGFRK
jgi:hypothetical protein